MFASNAVLEQKLPQPQSSIHVICKQLIIVSYDTLKIRIILFKKQAGRRRNMRAALLYGRVTSSVTWPFDSTYSTTLVISSQIARESFRRRISVTSESSAIAVIVTNCYSWSCSSIAVRSCGH